MRSHLLNIVRKELLEIFRDPKLFLSMIIVPILIFPMMGLAIGTSLEATEAQLERIEVCVWNLDGNDGNAAYSDLLTRIMLSQNISLSNASASNADEAVAWCVDRNLNLLITIPENFTEAISSGNTSVVGLYQILRRYGFTEIGFSGRVMQAVSTFQTIVVAERLHAASPGAPVEGLLEPVSVSQSSVVKGDVVDIPPDAIIGTVSTTGMMMPMLIMLLVMMAAQLAATSVAMEKEQKTMEVLLSLPIKRIYILIGKLSGVIVVSLIATLSYVVGFSYYMQSLQIGGGETIDLAAAGLSPEIPGYALLMVSLFLAFITALSLAVLLAAYTKDVRSAQSLMGLLYLPLMIPALVLMFAPLDILPLWLQGIMYALPFSYPILASQALYTKEYLVVIAGIFYQLAFTIIILYIATRLYSSEKVLTAKLEFGKKRKKLAD